MTFPSLDACGRESLTDVKRSSEILELVFDLAFEIFGYREADLRGVSRARKLTRVRQLCMWVMTEVGGESLAATGQAFDRDHSTVLHARNSIGEAEGNEAEVRDRFAAEVQRRAILDDKGKTFRGLPNLSGVVSALRLLADEIEALNLPTDNPQHA